jgi:hypothetical protein
VASNTGDYSAASNTGAQSAALVTGFQSKADVEQQTSVAVAVGKESAAKGKKGSWIVVAERDDDWNIVNLRTAQIDGVTLKEDIFYTLANNEFVNAENLPS